MRECNILPIFFSRLLVGFSIKRSMTYRTADGGKMRHL